MSKDAGVTQLGGAELIGNPEASDRAGLLASITLAIRPRLADGVSPFLGWLSLC